MKAAVWHGAGDVRIEERPEPSQPGPGQAVVEVRRAAVCGSDLSEYRDGPHLIPTGRPHPLTGRAAPITLGHEYSGVVVAVGEGVTGLRPGDRVCGDSCLRCGTCYWCLRGEYNICRLGASVGLHADGAFARYLEVPAYLLEKVPDNVSDEVAAIVEPLAVGLHATDQGGLRTGDNVVVVGYGMIGAAAAVMARAGGAARIFVVEVEPARRRLALEMGASEAFDPRQGSLRREITRRTDGVGADLVVDCTGRPEAFADSIEMSRRGGRIALCGLGHEPARVDLNRLVHFERQVVGVLGYRYDHGRVLSLLSNGRLQVSQLLGGPVPLAEIVPQAFDRMLKDPSAPLRVLVDMQPIDIGETASVNPSAGHHATRGSGDC